MRQGQPAWAVSPHEPPTAVSEASAFPPKHSQSQQQHPGLLSALGIPLVGRLAGTRRAASSARPPTATTLSVHGRAVTTATAAARRRVRGRVAATRAAAAGPDSRSGEGEGLDTVVHAHGRVGVVVLVGTGELDRGTGAATAASCDLDLYAGDVVLRLADVRTVDT